MVTVVCSRSPIKVMSTIRAQLLASQNTGAQPLAIMTKTRTGDCVSLCLAAN